MSTDSAAAVEIGMEEVAELPMAITSENPIKEAANGDPAEQIEAIEEKNPPVMPEFEKGDSKNELLQSNDLDEDVTQDRLADGNADCLRERLKKKRNLVLAAATLQSFVGEFVGTFILVTAICTAVTLAVIVGALSGLWQVTVLIGIGLGLGIYVSAHISDAHLNPAVTLAFAIVRYRVFSWKKIPIYVTAQMLGGFFAAAIMYGFYHGAVESFEDNLGLERGSNGSERTAMIFGEYFPNPAAFGSDTSIVSIAEAFFIEAWGTAVLVFVIFSLTDSHNTTVGSGNNKVVVPILIGLTLSFLVSMYGPLTQGGYNPARDFGPRLFAALVGWGRIAIPGPRNGFWLYIIAPLIGGPIGGALHDLGVANITRLKRFVKPAKQF